MKQKVKTCHCSLAYQQQVMIIFIAILATDFESEYNLVKK